MFLLITTWDKARSLNFTYWLFGSESFVVLYRNDKNCVKKLHVNHVTCSWLRIKTGDLNQFVFLGCVGWSLVLNLFKQSARLVKSKWKRYLRHKSLNFRFDQSVLWAHAHTTTNFSIHEIQQAPEVKIWCII